MAYTGVVLQDEHIAWFTSESGVWAGGERLDWRCFALHNNVRRSLVAVRHRMDQIASVLP